MAEAAFRGRNDIPAPTRSGSKEICGYPRYVRNNISRIDSEKEKGILGSRLDLNAPRKSQSRILFFGHCAQLPLILATCMKDYHSVAVNPSFGGHGTWLSFTLFLHGSLRVEEHSHPQPPLQPEILNHGWRSVSLFHE